MSAGSSAARAALMDIVASVQVSDALMQQVAEVLRIASSAEKWDERLTWSLTGMVKAAHGYRAEIEVEGDSTEQRAERVRAAMQRVLPGLAEVLRKVDPERFGSEPASAETSGPVAAPPADPTEGIAKCVHGVSLQEDCAQCMPKGAQ